jgi:pimeloyl-ACP methyl ester carboxylesterase
VSWRRIRRIVRRIWIGAGVAFTGWMWWAFQSHGVPQGTFASDERVHVEHVSGSWRFRPLVGGGRAGLVFLPGGLVDARAYGPLARALASDGHPVAIVELPFRMARTPEAEAEVRERARQAREALGADRAWVLGGHSRGAAIATRLASVDLAGYQGLALIGTTHPRVDLGRLEVPVLKVGGTRDCVAPRDRSEASAALLPSGTEWSWIEGGNHAQFGYYGPQLGDCRAGISREEQQRALRGVVAALLERVGRSDP